MFDYLKCEYPLVIPEALKEDEGFDIEKLEFQTYSFPPSCMDEYEITEDGQLYKWEIERRVEKNGKDNQLELREIKKDLTKEDYTGEVTFSSLYLGEKIDYFMEYKAVFWKGDLKELNLENVEEEDSSVRKKAQKKLNNYVSNLEKKKNKWWFPLTNVLRKVVMFINFLIRWVLGKLVQLTWKVDRWIN